MPMPPPSTAPTCGTRPSIAAACILVALQSGCTSALTTAYLREGLWQGSEHAASTPQASDAAEDDVSAPPAGPASDPAAGADRERREAALEEAMSRLSRMGALDAAVEAALVATLQRTEPEDWPVVVEEFSASLAASTPSAPADAAPVPETTDAPPPAAAVEEPPAEPALVPADPAPVPPLAVRTACFASAVRAWGDVDRFAADRFRPGQEVIVYVELENLSAGTSPAGHTTCIDASVRLVDEAGRTVHAWTFDPVAETRATRRHDYFARYVLAIPESAPPGACRVELDVTDALAGSMASAALPLEIAAAE